MPSANHAPEISPRDLASVLEAGQQVQVLDVRAPERLNAGRIDLAPAGRFHNIRGSEVLRLSSLEGTALDPALPVAVYCGRGRDSRVVTEHLIGLGVSARSVAGGFAAWNRLTLPRRLPAPPRADALVQFDRLAKGALGYLLASDGEALVVDPPLDASAFVEVAEELGARIVAVADTHVHADYVSGAARLARELRVPCCLHAADNAYPYDGTPGRLAITPVADGDTLSIGRARVRVHHNPGHTLGSVSFVVEEQAALTGDFFFVGSVGRPDLAGKTAEWTALLWESVDRARREWPGTMAIYPAHYSGEAEREADRTVGAPFARLLETNPALRHATAAEFSAWVAGRVGAFPDAYRMIKAVNVGLVGVTDEQVEELEVGRNQCGLGGT